MEAGEVPVGLGFRGGDMWTSLTDGRQWDAAWEVLILEACRIADRLEQLNDVIAGKGVLKLMHFRHVVTGEETKIEMTVDAVLMEAREQAGALRQIISQLKLGQASEKKTGRSALDDLAARRTGRRSEAAG